MKRKSFQDMNCSVAQTLEVVGEWWTMLIIRDCLLGVTRFDEFQASLDIARNVLTNRLNNLVQRGILTRVAYQQRPIRYAYRLTEKGRDLWTVLTALRQWGDRWEAPHGPPLVIEHKACGHQALMVPTCSACGKMMDARAVRALPGPGALREDGDVRDIVTRSQ
jgi:DNA-binding HxlR family transcriptional regulator